jgi:hypothetical protein
MPSLNAEASSSDSRPNRPPYLQASRIADACRQFWQHGLTGSTFRFDRWTPHGRITLVLSLGQTCLLVGGFLRIRVGYFIQSMHPDYDSSKWAPFAKSLTELSLFVMTLGIGLTIISLHRWLQGSADAGHSK